MTPTGVSRPGTIAPRRVLIIGGSGSGKTTLARRLADRWSSPFIPSDGAFWNRDWKPAPATQVTAWLADVLSRSAWVLDGNFDNDCVIAWAAAELIVWLDLPWPVTVGRVVVRNLRWWATRATVWDKGSLPLGKALDGIRHAARSHRLKRRLYPDRLADLSDVEVVSVRSTGALRQWLSAVGC